jgi:glutathione S-transferase
VSRPNPRLYPSDPYDYARALWFEEYGDSGLVPVIGPKIVFERVVGPRFFGHTTNEAVVQQAIETDLPPLFLIAPWVRRRNDVPRPAERAAGGVANAGRRRPALGVVRFR